MTFEKSVISYISIKSRFLLDISIVRKKMSKTSYRNWKKKNEFTDYVDSLYVPPHCQHYVYILCSCGEEYFYADKEEIPEESFVCNCGQKVIEYSSEIP
jgi:hypothetical protein